MHGRIRKLLGSSCSCGLQAWSGLQGVLNLQGTASETERPERPQQQRQQQRADAGRRRSSTPVGIQHKAICMYSIICPCTWCCLGQVGTDCMCVRQVLCWCLCTEVDSFPRRVASRVVLYNITPWTCGSLKQLLALS